MAIFNPHFDARHATILCTFVLSHEGRGLVFFGPDTVRFVDAIRRHLAGRAEPPRRVVDIGCGAGPGGIVVASDVANVGVMLLEHQRHSSAVCPHQRGRQRRGSRCCPE